jgi:DNA-directed RNA polymerase subunit RPC12/RpoP
MTTDPEEFVCARCGGRFVKAISDDEADREAETLWGYRRASQKPREEMPVVCEDCFREFMQWFRTRN